MLLEYTEFTLDPEILAVPGVTEALGGAISGLVSSGTLTVEQAQSILSARQIRTVHKGTISKLATLCGGDVDKMEQTLEALGSTAVTYLK